VTLSDNVLSFPIIASILGVGVVGSTVVLLPLYGFLVCLCQPYVLVVEGSSVVDDGVVGGGIVDVNVVDCIVVFGGGDRGGIGGGGKTLFISNFSVPCSSNVDELSKFNSK
jgi:hypothetical protein